MVDTISIASSTLSNLWTPIEEYPPRIEKRSKLRGWNLTDDSMNNLGMSLQDHDGPLTPTGVSIWLGDLKITWIEMMAWIEDGVKALGFSFQDYIGYNRLSFYPGSECAGRCKVDDVDLDLSTYWDSIKGVVPTKVRLTRSKWPGLEVATLLALNPQILTAMDGKTVPYMFAAGLVGGGLNPPVFGCSGREAYVHDLWDFQHTGTSVVAYRQ